VRPRHALLAAVALATLCLSVWRWPSGGAGSEDAERPGAERQGAALWRGDLSLTARIAGHPNALPAAAARCINCHGAVRGVLASAADTDLAELGAPTLTARQLREPRARRGGPPSRYGAASFCTLLRTGVDPASVLLPREMPRYEITDADCTALWIHLTRNPA
jgi:hypothetical protein